MKNGLKYTLITIVIGWFLGAASGLLIMRYAHFKEIRRLHFSRLRAHIVKELGLTAEQVARLDVVLQDSRQKLDRIAAETQSRVEEVRNSTRAQVRQMLRPDQIPAFEKFDAKMQERHRKKLLDEGPPPP